MNFRDDQVETQIKEIFRKVREVPVDASPYLKTRVLAELRERRTRSSGVLWWKRFALFTASISLAVVAWVMISNVENTFKASTNEAVAVKVEVQKNVTGIAFARIDLPEGVSFYSKAHPEIQDQRTLELAWDSNLFKSGLPFVIRSAQKGTKTIHIKFYDGHNKLAQEKTINIRFTDS